MFETIKKKIAYFLISRKYRVEKVVKSFSKIYSDSKKILVVVNPAVGNLKSVIRLMTEFLNDGKKVTIFVSGDQVDSFSQKSKYSFIQYSIDELTKFQLPRQPLEDRIRMNEFDLIIDLDFEESLLNYAVSSLCGAKYSIGFQKDKSDRFYNFQVPIAERNYEISYGNLLNSLRMF